MAVLAKEIEALSPQWVKEVIAKNEPEQKGHLAIYSEFLLQDAADILLKYLSQSTYTIVYYLRHWSILTVLRYMFWHTPSARNFSRPLSCPS
jgi:hypothetical protein